MASLDGDVEVPMEIESVRILDKDSILRASAFVYVCCGITDTTMLLDYITSMCNKRHCRSGLCAVYCDPLPLRGGPPSPGFLLIFADAVQAVTVHSFLQLDEKIHIWVYISEQFAAEIAKTSVSIGKFWVLPPLPPMPMTVHPMSPAHHRPASHCSSSRYQPYYSSRMTQASPFPPSSLRTDKPPGRHTKRGLKKNRGGNSKTLSERFNKSIWDIIETITDEELASCTEAQQKFIHSKRGKGGEEGSSMI
jgi:hypothetical protein